MVVGSSTSSTSSVLLNAQTTHQESFHIITDLSLSINWTLDNLSSNLDFDARVPIPFSVFPSSYANTTEDTTRIRVEGEANLPRRREDQETRYSSFQANLPNRQRAEYEKDEVNLYHEDRDRRTRREEDVTYYHEDRHHQRDRFPEVELSRQRYHETPQRYSETKIDIEAPRREEEIDVTEREYRRRVQPTYDVNFDRHTTTLPREEVNVHVETTVERPEHKSKMGYYDDEGHYHSFRHGIEKAADRVFHPFHSEPHRHRTEREEIIVDEHRGPTRVREGIRENVRVIERGMPPHTITIPCHHIRTGDLLILQGRPCQVIRITTSAQTGQHRYLGVDLFTKQLHEESSFVSNPSPSVIVQNMLGPVFKQYRVLDIRDDGRVVAMTETGDVKQSLPVIDQGGLWSRLNESFANGRGSVRVLVINDGGRELAVDYKVIHGSRL
ncbi:MAG: hypothetical protein LQ345_003267 [Seirophora villosa]|nr:MAG: hypothetical protein LQ345_003267 [Seirophora villosa]